jgi:serine/threonine-protein kinase HipA
MARELNIWFFGECVGALTQDEGYLSFRYSPEWFEIKQS